MTGLLKQTSLTVILLLAFGSVYAVPIVGTTDPANNSAELTVVSSSSTQLALSLENTSNFEAIITGFAFSLFDGLANSLLTVSGTLNDGEWSFSADADSGNGTFDLNLESYAITGSNINGGDPLAGIPVASTGYFLFGGIFGGGVGVTDAFARWQNSGIDGEGSDYGSACIDDPCVQVSEPATLTLLSLGLFVAGAAARRRRLPI